MIVCVEMAIQRIASPTEEGFRREPYWDKTQEAIVPGDKGNPTWLYGCNLATSGSRELGKLVLRYQVTKNCYQPLIGRNWFMAINDARKSVCLDIAFNQGMHGLLDYPHMIAALADQNYPEAAAQCTVSPSSLPGVIKRYAALAEILRTGTDPGYVA